MVVTPFQRESPMFKPLLLLSTLLFLGAVPQEPATPPPTPQTATVPTIPAAAAAAINPAKSTPEAMAHAKRMYSYDCAICHGDTGNGKGEVALSMGLKLKDWTDPAALQGKTDGELFYIISNGLGQMPAEGAPRATAQDNWHMVLYVR